MKAKIGVQNPTTRAAPEQISPRGTRRANSDACGIATRARYHALIGPGDAWDHSASWVARMDGSVNQRILPRPSKTKNTPMQMRRTAQAVVCLFMSSSLDIEEAGRAGQAG
jgi:hypothetical protein